MNFFLKSSFFIKSIEALKVFEILIWLKPIILDGFQFYFINICY
jgi:hypothetical protein